MIAALTGMGLSAAAGLNAYIPFLVVVALVALAWLLIWLWLKVRRWRRRRDQRAALA